MPPIAILVALADPTRCRIIEILQGGPQPVHQIAAAFEISRPAISRHLGVLKDARLISEKKSGRENHYHLQAKRLKPVQDWMARVTLSAKLSGKADAIHRQPVPITPGSVTMSVTDPAIPAPVAKPAIVQMDFDF